MLLWRPASTVVVIFATFCAVSAGEDQPSTKSRDDCTALSKIEFPLPLLSLTEHSRGRH